MEKILIEPRKKIFSIILSAGEGSRYKRGFKLLHQINGKPMLQVVIDLIEQLSFSKNFLVVNPLWNEIENNFKIPENFIILKNFKYKEGISTSIKLAIKEVIKQKELPEYIAIFLADMPFITKEDVLKILKFCDGKNKIIAPFFEEKKGFPTFVHNSLFADLLTIEGDSGIKQIIKKNPELLSKVKFDSNRVILDIDQ
ncbi:MAG: molybdenum cofactor cytidylyltransferase [Thermosipho sp. (in: thermotogales)]|nr:molybdenum cofactor cytidylyltransferase [Thermosipho sp. (in: thermotogales)]MDN5324924.1 molybdenum cofactor cytidylyltransferase [Thermosipho sp. (in: thermotogales)]